MSERGGRRTILVLAGVVLLCAAVALVGLLKGAAVDENPNKWTGRILGFVMAAVGAVVAVAMFRFGRPGETHYWGLVSGLMIAAILTGAYSYKPKAPHASGKAEKIPTEIGEWIGYPFTVPDYVMKDLLTTDVIERQYRRGDDTVNLAVVYSEGKRKSAHPPEQCYSAAGSETEELTHDTLLAADGREVNCRRLVIRKPESRLEPGEAPFEAILYWYKADALNTGNIITVSLYAIWSDLTMSSGTRIALVRLSTPLATASKANTDHAFGLLKEFGGEAFPEIEKALGDEE